MVHKVVQWALAAVLVLGLTQAVLYLGGTGAAWSEPPGSAGAVLLEARQGADRQDGDEAVAQLRGELGRVSEELKAARAVAKEARKAAQDAEAAALRTSAAAQEGGQLRIGIDVPDEDPLNDEDFIQGFPTKARGYQDLKLCDHKTNIVMRGHWECEEDVTCEACHKRPIRRYQELRSVFDAPEFKAARLAQLEAQFGRGRADKLGKPLVVSALNYGQLYLFLNWVCSCERVGVDPRGFTVVVPTDDDTATYLRKLGFYTVDHAWVHKLSRPIAREYSGAANVGGHSDINNVLLLVAAELLLDLGHHVLVHDVDMVWTTDVRNYLVESGVRRDILAMHAPFYVAKGGINTGFVFLRNTFKTRIYVGTLVNVAAIKHKSDQILFNVVLRHVDFQQLSYRILPNTLFYKYSGRRAPKPTSQMLAYHAVGIHKRSSFQIHGVWFFQEGCSVYDAELDAYSKEHVNEGLK